MAAVRDVAVLVGSLRKASFNRAVAGVLAGLAPASLALRPVEIRALPLYDQDEEESPPPAWVAFREAIRPADALLFVTPEYNRSVPAALKNAVDVGSRPPGKSVWNGKPGAVVSASPGAMGGYGASQHLRQSLAVLNVPVMPQPEVYLAGVHKLLDADGRLTNESTLRFLTKVMEAFAAWIEIQLRR
jgi:chromate reductase